MGLYCSFSLNPTPTEGHYVPGTGLHDKEPKCQSPAPLHKALSFAGEGKMQVKKNVGPKPHLGVPESLLEEVTSELMTKE